MSLNWRKIDYFSRLLKQGQWANSALEMMVDDLHKDKKHTISAFLAHFGAEDFMWALVRMLASENCRVAGNAAYIFGTLAEHGHGQSRVMGLINGEHPHNILADLTTMLEYDDTESVMNAAGTLGTLAETDAGRDWMLLESCIDITIGRVTELLTSMNMWTASNAALVLARLSISEEGSQRLLDHRNSLQILTKLVDSLGMDEAGRGMNAAFAIGRLCDLDDGRKRLLHHKDSNKMIGSLCNMLSSKDSGCGKNACYALSCLAGSDEGHERLLNHRHSELVLIRLGEQLSNEDSETGWFAAMTLRTLASKRKGCLRMRDHNGVIPPLKEIHLKHHPHQELKEEVDLTLALLKRLEKPVPPRLEVKGAQDIMVLWDLPDIREGVEAKYRLYCGERQIYEGKDPSFLVTRLRPNLSYNFKLQVITEGDDSPFSDFALATTEESVPDAPEALRALQITTSQVKLGWSPPEFDNGALKGYYVYNGKHQVESISELSCIVSGLSPGTSYDLCVCAYNHKGKGPKTKLSVTTTNLGKHAPGKPTLTVRGRLQMHVAWAHPEFPLGRFHRFDLTQNGKVIYSGTDLNCTASRLTENTEYTFTVIAVTSEGKCESEPARKKTPKAEYNVQSTAPTYFSHPVRNTESDVTEKSKDKTSKSRSKRSITSPNKHGKSIRSTSPVYTDQMGSVSRPLSALSSMTSASKSKHRRKSTGMVTDSRKIKKVGIVHKGETSRRNVLSGFSSASSESEDDGWPGSMVEDTPGNRRGTSVTSMLSHEDACTNISGTMTRRTKSDSGVATLERSEDDDDSIMYPISVKIKTNSVPVVKDIIRDHVSGNLIVDGPYRDDSERFESSLFKQTHASSQRLSERTFVPMTDASKSGLSVANVKEGAIEALYPHQGNTKNPKKQSSPSKSHHSSRTAPELAREAKKLDRLLSSLNQDTAQIVGGNKYTKQQVADVLEDTIAQQLQRSLAIYDDPNFELSGFNPSQSGSPRASTHSSGISSSGRTDDRMEPMTVFHPEFGQFTVESNGHITHENVRPRTTASGKNLLPSSSGDYHPAARVHKTHHGLAKHSHGGLKAARRPIESHGQFNSGPYATTTDGVAAAGDSGKLGMSSAPSWLTNAKGELADSTIPSFRSMLADTPSFHQRANAITSSHRPTLKKNLARIAAYPQPFASAAVGPSAQSAGMSSAFDPDFPDLPYSKKTANKYSFIPTQFRTQPVNLPGSPHKGDGPSTTAFRPAKNQPLPSTFERERAYLRKLDVMSHLSPTQRKKQMCLDCKTDNDPDAIQVALHLTHRHDPPRASSRHKGQVT